jgi:hypothetical protein
MHSCKGVFVDSLPRSAKAHSAGTVALTHICWITSGQIYDDLFNGTSRVPGCSNVAQKEPHWSVEKAQVESSMWRRAIVKDPMNVVFGILGLRIHQSGDLSSKT